MDGIRMRSLTDETDRIALRGVRVHATLVGLAQRTRVEQTFVNRERRAIEAAYTFPLPDGAAVCGFEVVTGDRVLTGTIDENDAAVERYESAIAAGDAAYLAEQDRPDVFTVRVGNLKPRQAATVRLTYVRPLDVVDGTIRVAFPTTVAPRYTTASGTDALDAAIDGDALNPPHVLDVPYGLTLSADVRLGRKVAGITSPSHAISVTGDDADGYHLLLTDAAMDGQVVLSIALAADVGTHVQVERGTDGAAYLAVTLAPELADAGDAPAPSEVVFVVDCSGSMQGDSISQATAALELCLRTLNVGDTFNICRFGSNFELMSPEPLPYTDATLARAVSYVRTTDANLGGTELLAPLEAVLRVPPPPGRLRTIVLLTDGQVSNEPAVLAVARRHAGRNRIFPFGIGPAVSTFLVNGLARATGGAAEFIGPGERIEPKVLRDVCPGHVAGGDRRDGRLGRGRRTDTGRAVAGVRRRRAGRLRPVCGAAAVEGHAAVPHGGRRAGVGGRRAAVRGRWLDGRHGLGAAGDPEPGGGERRRPLGAARTGVARGGRGRAAVQGVRPREQFDVVRGRRAPDAGRAERGHASAAAGAGHATGRAWDAGPVRRRRQDD